MALEMTTGEVMVEVMDEKTATALLKADLMVLSMAYQFWGQVMEL